MEIQIYNKETGKNDSMHATIKGVAGQIAKVMHKHIGHLNSISSDSLFRKVYGFHKEDINEYQRWVLVTLLRQGNTYLKQSKLVFMSTIMKNQQYHYFVMKNQGDVKRYHDRIDGLKKGLDRSKKVAQSSVDERWYLKVDKVANKLLGETEPLKIERKRKNG